MKRSKPRSSKKASTKKKKVGLIQGTISIHPRGFGFVVVSEGEDVFIPKSRTNGALSGDTVLITLFPPTSKGPEGEVSKIVARKRSELVGVVEKQIDRASFQIFAPLLTREKTVIVRGKNLALKVGDRILASIEKWGDDAIFTRCVKKLGTIEEADLDIDAAILEYELRSEFPEAVLKETSKIPLKIPLQEIKRRKDLRQEATITIDPDTAKDFDDALSIKKFDNGHYLLDVHIADVSHYVKSHSALDKEAEERANSTYFPGRCLPMLPHTLSDGLCSLQPDKARLTITVQMKFDEEGTLLDFSIFKSVIQSQKRFTYKEAKLVLEGKKRSKFRPLLETMRELALLLKKKRAERGSVEFSLSELALQVDEKGMPTGFELIEYDITHQLVEEFMLKANEIVAIHLTNKGKNLPYRVHGEPNIEAMQEFIEIARMTGFPLSKNPTHKELSELFKDAERRSILAPQFIRRMKMALYSTDNIGHFGLQLTHYCHFTSPIRRYVDLVAHRILFGESDDLEHLEWLVEHTSEKERLSAKAEGSVKTLKKIRFAEIQYDLDKKREYTAVVTKLKPFGIFFDVVEFGLEGFFHVSELGNDWWHFDPLKAAFVGEKTKREIRLGTTLPVYIDKVDLIHQEVAWKMAQKRK